MHGLNTLNYMHNRERIDAERRLNAGDPGNSAQRKAEADLDVAVARAVHSLSDLVALVNNASNCPQADSGDDQLDGHLMVLPYSDRACRVFPLSRAAREALNNAFQPGMFRRHGLYYIVPTATAEHVVGLVHSIISEVN